jgi:Ca2+-binding EF-hand superfamily protein
LNVTRHAIIALAIFLASTGVARAQAIHVIAFGDRRPILLTVQVRVEGKSLDDVWRAHQKALFAYLDRDGDGVLTEAEARRAPSAEQVRRQFGSDLYTPLAGGLARFADLDAARKGKVGLQEFSDYYRREGVGPLWIVPGDPPGKLAALSEALFHHLDTDHDGKLSKKELAAAGGLIRRLDADDDEYLSPDELLAGRPGTLKPVVKDDDKPRFFVLAAGDAPRRRAELAEMLLAHYGKDGKGSLGRAEINLNKASFDRLDANRDDRLDAGELAHFASLPADAEYVVDLGKAGDGSVAAKGRAVRDTLLEGARFDLECSPRALNLAGIRSLYFQQFRTADRDRTGFIEKKQVEAPALRLLQLLFPLADRDEDGRLTEKELGDYLDLHAQGAGAFVSMAVTARRGLLFEMLDADGDGRLGHGDLRLAATRLVPFIREGEAGLTAEDLPRRFALVFTRGPFAVNAKRDPTKTENPRSPAEGAVPAWFRHMDRNGDGVLSPREFLGSPETFRKLDTDGDGLISIEEARQADVPRKP